ncbi:MAG: type III pantothenate kinase [candidate division WOR-3 bacterium]|nr:MAG: type III pantothenate kinase [candidate division WOR-3 bacterium]
MVVVFDIGNTNIHIGSYKGHTLKKQWSFPTKKNMPVRKVKAILADKRVEGMAVASVVPRLTRLVRIHGRKLGLPVNVVSTKVDCGLEFKYHDPKTLGADRIAAVVGALTRYARDVIVVDAGTAITIDVALSTGDYLGGVICPGMHILSEMMHDKTALLPRVVVKKTRTLVGRSTEECLQSGIFNGTMFMLSGLVREIRRRHGRDFFCVATGGGGELVSRHVEDVERFDADLCMYGALIIYYRNVSSLKK